MVDYPAFDWSRQKYKVQVAHVSLVVHARVICIYLGVLKFRRTDRRADLSSVACKLRKTYEYKYFLSHIAKQSLIIE